MNNYILLGMDSALVSFVLAPYVRRQWLFALLFGLFDFLGSWFAPGMFSFLEILPQYLFIYGIVLLLVVMADKDPKKLGFFVWAAPVLCMSDNLAGAPVASPLAAGLVSFILSVAGIFCNNEMRYTTHLNGYVPPILVITMGILLCI